MKEIIGEGLRWIDVEHPSKADLERIHREFPQFHQLALEDTLSPIQRPKIDEFDDHLFIVLHFPVFEKRTHKITSSEIDMFVGKDYVVTLHDGRLKPLTELVDEALDDTKMRKEIFGKEASFLVYNILNPLLDYCFPILYKNDVNLDILEDKIFEGGEFSKLVEEISIERRNVLNYRRIISPQRAAVVGLEGAMRKLGFTMADVYFDDLVDHIEKIWGSLEEQKEVVEGLNEANLALVNTITNDVVRVLTVIAVIFLPLTLIASLYGMNVSLPFMDYEYAFEVVLGIMLLLLLLMIFFFRKKHWI
jgi:magnesium transporter